MKDEDLNTDLVMFYVLKWWRNHKSFLKWYWGLKKDEFDKQIKYLQELETNWKMQEFLDNYFI